MDKIIELVAAFLFAKVTVTLILMAFNRDWIKDFKEITMEWVHFMKRGIPIPSDHLKIEHPLRSQPTLIPLNFRYRKPAPKMGSIKN